MRVTSVLALCAIAGGCFKAPNVVLVDRKTALEQQAGGSFRGLEDDLEQAGISPRPAPLTRAKIASSGAATSADERALADREADTDAQRVDGWLVRRCAGEANDGTLVATLPSCTGTVDVALVNRTLARLNRNRVQIWRYLAAQPGAKTKGSGEAEVKKVWRATHLEAVICDGQVQREDGTWELKRC